MDLSRLPGGDLVKKGLEDPDSAHGRFNALLGRLTSFENALECVA